MSESKFTVLVGPYRAAKRYAAAKGWSDEKYAIVVRAHQLYGIDPARIGAIVAVKTSAMSDRVVREIYMEIDRLRRLWPVPLLRAAA